MKLISDHLGQILAALAAVCLLITSVVFFRAPVGDFFSGIINSEKSIGERVLSSVDDIDLSRLGDTPAPEFEPSESLETLQSKYSFTYYSTLSGAVTDVNNDTIGDNADSVKENAVAGVYVASKGVPAVVLLKNTSESESLIPTKNMTINLGGHVLTSTATRAISGSSENACTINIDGRLEGSGIVSTNSTTVANISTYKSRFNIEGGTYTSNSTSTAINILCNGGELNISDASFNASSDTKASTNIQIGNTVSSGVGTIKECNLTTDGCTEAQGVKVVNGEFDASDSKISAVSDDYKAYGVTSTTQSNVTLQKCDITAYSNYTLDYSKIATGVWSSGTLTVTDCDVSSVHSGIESSGVLYLNGGSYEGHGHGGIYVSGDNSRAYIRNATLKECDMPEGYTALDANDNDAGMYIGSGSGIKVYMDNCTLYGTRAFLRMRNSGGEEDNELYISNSSPTSLSIKYMNATTHKVYIGKGCGFGVENVNPNSAAVVTDEVYIME